MEEKSNNPSEDSEDIKDTSASNKEAQADAVLEGAKSQSNDNTKSNHNKIIALIILLLLLVGGGYFLLSSSSSDETSTDDTSTTDGSDANGTQEPSQIAEPDEFDNIVYLHAGSDTQKRSLHTRPVAGGDRADLGFDIPSTGFVYSDYEGQSYVFASQEGDVYVGTGTDKPVKAYTASDDVEGVVVDEGSKTAVILERDFADFTSVRTTVTRVNLSEPFAPEVLLSDSGDGSGVPFLEDWNGDTETLFIRRSCTQCDGYDANLIKVDAEGNESDVFSSTPEFFNRGSGYVFNSDSSMALFMTLTEYAASKPHGIQGGHSDPEGAPYTLHEVDLASGSSSEIVTFGAPEDAPSNGFFDSPVAFWVDGDSGQRRSYAYQQKLFVQSGNGNFDNYFETGQGPIASIYAVDQDEVVVGASNSDGQTISYFNIDTQEGAIVMETLFTTTILGVTLK